MLGTIRGMFFAPAPPVHVIVDQLASSPGLPIWATTLISAGAGAITALAANTTLEVIKPRLKGRRDRASTCSHLANEIMWNMEQTSMAIADLGKMGSLAYDEKSRAVIPVVNRLIETFERKAFDSYRQDRKFLLFSVGESREIDAVYNRAQNAPLNEGLPEKLMEKLSRDVMQSGETWLGKNGRLKEYQRRVKG